MCVCVCAWESVSGKFGSLVMLMTPDKPGRGTNREIEIISADM